MNNQVLAATFPHLCYDCKFDAHFIDSKISSIRVGTNILCTNEKQKKRCQYNTKLHFIFTRKVLLNLSTYRSFANIKRKYIG
jgi:hypothetical protein